MSTHRDIVIIGGGMVGATLALALNDSGLRVALVEASEPVLDWPAGSVDTRVSAITAASQQMFVRLGIWPQMKALGVCPFSEMHVWDASGSGEIHFDCAEIGEPRLGHIIENRVIQRALFESLREHDGIEWFCPAGLAGLEECHDGVTVELTDGRQLTAKLAVGADGARSGTRAAAGISVRGWGYEQKALVATVETERDHHHTARQRFLPDGPLAFLPLCDGRSSIVWSTAMSRADELIAADEATFNDRLAEAFEYRLGRVTASGPRAVFPLRLQHATRYMRRRVVLVGDAAHTIHPLAGQGVNLGLLDAGALAEVLRDAAAAGRDPGAESVLRRYERWRKGDNLLMMGAMDGFKRLFGSTSTPLRLARNLGLNLVDAASPVKHRIIQYAMGLRGDLPRIARQARV